MKTKYIIGIVAALVFVVVAIFSFNSNTVDYADFPTAQKSGKTVQIIGSWVKETPTSYNPSKNTFEFVAKDEKQNKAKVIFHGSKPQNFDIAPMVVIKGRFENENFIASEVLTKCPSKYEGKMEKQASN